MRSLSCCVLLPILAVLAACGASAAADDVADDIDARVIDAPTSDATDLDLSKVYGHSGLVLYRLDTTTLLPVEIGPFANTGPLGILDIAIDRNDRMLGITRDDVYTININTGAATRLTAFAAGTPDLTSLAFVPVDLNNPNSAERLVAAADDGTVLEINQSSGVTSMLGSYGTAAGGIIKSSGDIVAVSGFGILATVTIGDPVTNPDYLAQINPTTWAATPLTTGTTYDKIFGLGFWKGKVYGFVDRDALGGAIIEINPTTGAATPVNMGTIRWFGAGVATDAPIID